VFENKEKDKCVLLLYSTSGCHLCDQAKSLIEQVALRQQFTLKIIDIANDDTLFEKYGVSIPVIKFERVHQELFWPFDLEELSSYLVLGLNHR
jgi:glutaredoxin